MAFTGNARFQLISLLGEGGMGRVYEVYDHARGMRVALKTLRTMSPSALYRFKREFRALSELSHPNIVGLYELVGEGENWFLVMELVHGTHFLSHVKGRPSSTVMSRDSASSASAAADHATTTIQSAPPTAALANRIAEPEDMLATVTQPHRAPWTESGHDLHAATDALLGPAESAALVPLIGERISLDKLRDALSQLASALMVLHGAGIVHRDLKPSNVMVTPEGRVVLMDFGIIAELRHERSAGLERVLLGTPAFMAPEQLQRAPSTPASDWYAFGTMMYLALTGSLPFRGSVLALTQLKTHIPPKPPSQLVGGIPEALETLCLRCLAVDAKARPTGDEVLAALGRARMPRWHYVASPEAGGMFVGRERELAELRRAYDAARAGKAVWMLVSGPSGFGKTSLVDAFVGSIAKAAQAGEQPLVLSGRCHERETLPFKAFDGVIDQLTDYLLALPPREAARLRPPNIELLSLLFPTLGRVQGVHAKITAEGRDPVATRGLAMAALRALLAALARSAPVVIRSEDIQWADRDSLVLIRELLRPPTPHGLLLVTTLRAGTDEPLRPLNDTITLLSRTCDVSQIELAPLSENEAVELAFRMLPDRTLTAQAVSALGRESHGHPLLLTELVRHLRDRSAEPGAAAAPAPGHALDLDGVLQSRISRLPAPALSLLELMALIGQPAPLRVLAEAASLSGLDRERAIATLRAASLSQLSRSGHDPWVDVYHDRMRQSVLAQIGARLPALHQALASALERWPEAPVTWLAQHWLAAGDKARGLGYLLRAARSIADQLAFEQAAELYRQILAVLDTDTRDRGSHGRMEHREEARLRCQAWIGLIEGMRVLDRADQAAALLDQAIPVATEHRLLDALASLHYLRGCLLFPRGDFAGCLREHAQAREYAQRAGSPLHEAKALSGLGDAYYLRGQMFSAYEYYDQCIELCRRSGFRSMEGANLSMRGLTFFYRNYLDAGLTDCADAIIAARDTMNPRAELIAHLVKSYIVFEKAEFDSARRAAERALELAASLGARRFVPNAMIWIARAHAVAGNVAAALSMLGESLRICRETGPAFVGPMVLGALALITGDPKEREAALAEGETLLSAGAAVYNHLYFRRDAMEAALKARAWDEVERHACALDALTQGESLPWSEFFVGRARALAAYGSGQRGPEQLAVLRRIGRQATHIGMHYAGQALFAIAH